MNLLEIKLLRILMYHFIRIENHVSCCGLSGCVTDTIYFCVEIRYNLVSFTLRLSVLLGQNCSFFVHFRLADVVARARVRVFVLFCH